MPAALLIPKTHTKKFAFRVKMAYLNHNREKSDILNCNIGKKCIFSKSFRCKRNKSIGATMNAV